MILCKLGMHLLLLFEKVFPTRDIGLRTSGEGKLEALSAN